VVEVPRVDEWLAELERLELDKLPGNSGGPDGFTGDELADKLGVCHRAALYKIKEWHRNGLVEYAGRRKVVNVVGSVSCIPVYRMKEKPK
jgi:CRP-like cAMP-binding protein